MINQQPILIAGPPRSGTIMLAGLIASHDVWVGRARTTQYPGTNPAFAAENIDIKNLMKIQALNLHYRNWRVPLPTQPTSWGDLKKQVESFVPENVPWLVKTSWTLTFHEFWRKAYPNALWILPYRKERAIFDSMNRHPRMKKRPDNMKRKFIGALHTRQDEVRDLVKHSHVVDVWKVSQLNGIEIESLFDFINIPIDWLKVHKWIEPKLMQR